MGRFDRTIYLGRGDQVVIDGVKYSREIIEGLTLQTSVELEKATDTIKLQAREIEVLNRMLNNTRRLRWEAVESRRR